MEKLRRLADYVIVIDDVLDEPTCQALIEKFESAEKTKTDSTWHEDYRSFEEVNITKDETFKDEQEVIYEATQRVLDTYKKAVNGKFFPDKIGLEELRMKRYTNNDNDQFGWHTDVGDYDSARRFLVAFYYLNDVEEGGETLFEELDGFVLKVKPKRGRVVMFPPMWMYPHKGEKPKSGNKYVISTYCHYL